MSKRHPHKKSRTGCSICKSRHVKCDETGPPCANCRVRSLDCDFDKPADDGIPVTTEYSHGTVAAVNSKRLELELLHQWTSETYRSIVFKDGDEDIWQTKVPQVAFQHEHLLNSIFAISSLHLAETRSSSLSQSYRLAALQYQNLAISAFRAEERSVTPESSQTLFAFSAINVVLAMAIPSSQEQELRSNLMDNLNTVLELLRGTVSIFKSSRTWLSSGPFGGIVRRPLDLHYENLDPATKHIFDRLRSFRDEDYSIRSVAVEGKSEVVYFYECMTDAIEHLEHCFGLCGDHGQIVPFSWLAELRLGFIDAMGRHEPLALLVTMHWAILLNTLSRERWWARSSGKRLVAEISMVLLSSKPEWLPAIAWVHNQVGLPPPSGA